MPRTLLIVEEKSSKYGACLAELLEDRFDTIRTAGSPAEAIEAAIQLRPDLVITPFPAVTRHGELLSALLKQDPRTSASRLLAYSDWSWVNTREKALKTGCDAFVPATAPVEELLAAVDLLVGTQPSGNRANGKTAAGTIDPARARSLMAEARVRRAAKYSRSRQDQTSGPELG